jgi:hypothetical protein
MCVLGETLELAALLSIKKADLASFERHVAQVKVYYQDARYVAEAANTRSCSRISAIVFNDRRESL